jgi:hypothetical protein
MEWERYTILAVSSIYGVDILEDNAIECREYFYGVQAYGDFATTCKSS